MRIEFEGHVPDMVEAVSWGLTTGTGPYITVLEYPKQEAIQIHSTMAGRPGTLKIGERSFSSVFPIGLQALPHPDRMGVILADIRWLLPYAQVGPLYFNVTAATGGLVSSESYSKDTSPDEVFRTRRYKPFSVQNGTRPYTSVEILNLVLEQVSYKIKELSGFDLNYSVDWEDNVPNGTIRENIHLQGTALDVIGVLMSELPGLGVYADQFGHLQFFDMRKPAENPIEETDLLPFGFQRIIVQDNSMIRPKAIRVYFDQLVDMRLDYMDNMTDSQIDNYSPVVYNVVNMPVGFVELQEVGITPTYAYHAGEVKSFEFFVNFVKEEVPLPLPELPAFTLVNIRNLMMFGGLRRAYTLAGFDVPVHPLWEAIVNEAEQSYRTKMQINPFFLGQCLGWQPARSQLRQTGERVPTAATISMNHATRQLTGMVNFSGKGQDQFLIENHFDYKNAFKDWKITKASVDMLDHDLGMFKVDIHTGYYEHRQAFPCWVYDGDHTIIEEEVDENSTSLLGLLALQANFNMMEDYLNYWPTAHAGYVFSFEPAPNKTNKYFLEIKPSDVQQYFEDFQSGNTAINQKMKATGLKTSDRALDNCEGCGSRCPRL